MTAAAISVYALHQTRDGWEIIAPSDDPLLSARSAIYSKSFTRRAGESKEPSAITPSEVRK